MAGNFSGIKSYILLHQWQTLGQGRREQLQLCHFNLAFKIYLSSLRISAQNHGGSAYDGLDCSMIWKHQRKDWTCETVDDQHSTQWVPAKDMRMGCGRLWRSILLNHTFSHCLTSRSQTETLLILFGNFPPTVCFLCFVYPLDYDQTAPFISLCKSYSAQSCSRGCYSKEAARLPGWVYQILALFPGKEILPLSKTVYVNWLKAASFLERSPKTHVFYQ